MPLGSVTGFQSRVTLLRHDNVPLGETSCGAGGPCVSCGFVGVRVGVGTVTLMVVWRVATLLPQRAVRTYVVVEDGETTRVPGVATPPMPGSMETESAFVTAPQLKVDDCPAMIDDGDALNEEIFGMPLQPAGGGIVGVRVAVGVVVIGGGIPIVVVRVGVIGVAPPPHCRASAKALLISLLSVIKLVASRLIPM